jgi:hypothetical protein
MSKFVLDEINNVNGTIRFYKLIEDGICYWNEFCLALQAEGTYYDQVFSITSQMNDKANLKTLPNTKHKSFNTKVKGVNGFEFRTRDLRAYGINDENGNVIIFAGKKANQGKDEIRFRSIVKRYIESKNE